MMRQFLRLALLALCGFAFNAAAGQTFVSVAWPESLSAHKARAALLRAGTLEKLVEIADKHTAMRGELAVVVNDAPRSGFDPATNTIILSYRHWQSIMQRAAAVGHKSGTKSIEMLGDDAMLYMAIRQLAHAVMAQQDPATQRLGADAVSDLTTVMLLEFVPNGARVAQSAMHLYDDSVAAYGDDPYWQEHGHSIDRVWSGTCHREGDTSQKNRTICRQNYNQMVASWAAVFAQAQAERMLETASR